MEKQGVVTKADMIVDTSFVEVLGQRNTRDGNKKIKERETSPGWENQPRKLSQKDADARWLEKNEETFHSYKSHIRADAGSAIITEDKVTGTPRSLLREFIARCGLFLVHAVAP